MVCQILITAATSKELQPFVSMKVSQEVALTPFLTGVGPYHTLLNLERLPIKQYQRWIHVGLVASCDESVSLGHIIQPQAFHLLEWRPPMGLFESDEAPVRYEYQKDSVTLWTSPIPLYNKKYIRTEGVQYLDMEGYVIAKEAKKRGIPFTCFQIVSDYCTKETPAKILRSIEEYSLSLSHYVTQQLKQTV